MRFKSFVIELKNEMSSITDLLSLFLFFLLFFFTSWISDLFGQDCEINVYLYDAVDSTFVSGTLVNLYRGSSEFSADYCISNKEGQCYLRVPIGEYRLMAKHLSYAPIVDSIACSEEQITNKKIYLSPQIFDLDQIEVAVSKNGIYIKGDTVMYEVDYYADRSTHSLRQVITRMPGLDIDEENNVIFNGRQVQRILLNDDDYLNASRTTVLDDMHPSQLSQLEVIDGYRPWYQDSLHEASELVLNVKTKDDKVVGLSAQFMIGSQGRNSTQLKSLYITNKLKVNLKLYNTTLEDTYFGVQDYLRLQSYDDYLGSSQNLAGIPAIVSSQERSNSGRSGQAILNASYRAPKIKLKATSFLQQRVENLADTSIYEEEINDFRVGYNQSGNINQLLWFGNISVTYKPLDRMWLRLNSINNISTNLSADKADYLSENKITESANSQITSRNNVLAALLGYRISDRISYEGSVSWSGLMQDKSRSILWTESPTILETFLSQTLSINYLSAFNYNDAEWNIRNEVSYRFNKEYSLLWSNMSRTNTRKSNFYNSLILDETGLFFKRVIDNGIYLSLNKGISKLKFGVSYKSALLELKGFQNVEDHWVYPSLYFERKTKANNRFLILNINAENDLYIPEFPQGVIDIESLLVVDNKAWPDVFASNALQGHFMFGSFNVKSERLTFGMVQYMNASGRISERNRVEKNIIIRQLADLSLDRSYGFGFTHARPIMHKKYRLKIKSSYSRLQNNVAYEASNTQQNLILISNQLRLKYKRFKHLHFDSGAQLVFNTFSSFGIVNQFYTLDLDFGVEFSYKDMDIFLKYVFQSYRSKTKNAGYNRLDFKLYRHIFNERFSLVFRAEDFLNIGRNADINFSRLDGVLLSNVVSRRLGFVSIGLKYAY